MRSRSGCSKVFMRISGLWLLTDSLCGLLTFAVTSDNAMAASASNPDVPHLLLQNWSKKLPSASRFTVLSAFGDAAVHDDETGLVWEKTLETAEVSWADARAACADKEVGGRKGWRLPSISELASLGGSFDESRLHAAPWPSLYERCAGRVLVGDDHGGQSKQRVARLLRHRQGDIRV